MLNMYDTGRLEAVYGMLGLLGPVRAGEDLTAASIASPVRTIAGRAHWPAPPASLAPLRMRARRESQPCAQLILESE